RSSRRRTWESLKAGFQTGTDGARRCQLELTQVFSCNGLYIVARSSSAKHGGCLIVGCLALNASFEPLTMVPLRRALRLVIDGKAEIVEADHDRVVRSERLTLPRPAVIRLTRFIHVP